MQATASVSYSYLLRYKITEERCSLQLNIINKDLKTNVEFVMHLPADCLRWKCLAHLWWKAVIIKVDMQKRFILVRQIPLVSRELRTTEYRAGFDFCSLKEPKWDYHLVVQAMPGEDAQMRQKGTKRKFPPYVLFSARALTSEAEFTYLLVELISFWL